MAIASVGVGLAVPSGAVVPTKPRSSGAVKLLSRV